MRDAVKNDRARVQIGKISQFGLLEMSRPAPACRRHRWLDRALPALRRPGHRALGREHGAAPAARPRGRGPEAEGFGGGRARRVDVAIYTLNQKRRELARIEGDYQMAIAFEPKEGPDGRHVRARTDHPEDARGKRTSSPPPSRPNSCRRPMKKSRRPHRRSRRGRDRRGPMRRHRANRRTARNSSRSRAHRRPSAAAAGAADADMAATARPAQRPARPASSQSACGTILAAFRRRERTGRERRSGTGRRSGTKRAAPGRRSARRAAQENAEGAAQARRKRQRAACRFRNPSTAPITPRPIRFSPIRPRSPDRNPMRPSPCRTRRPRRCGR